MNVIQWLTKCQLFGSENGCSVVSLTVNEEDGANLVFQAAEMKVPWEPTKTGCVMNGVRIRMTKKLPRGAVLVSLKPKERGET